MSVVNDVPFNLYLIVMEQTLYLSWKKLTLKSSGNSCIMKVAERASQVKLLEPSECPTNTLPNVIILSTFPWYTTESDIYRHLCYVHPSQAPTTVRLYTNPVNGSSRGHCFVEYASYNKGNVSQSEHRRARKHSRIANYNETISSSSSNVNENNYQVSVMGESSAEQRAKELHYALLVDVKQRVESIALDGLILTARLYYLTSNKWDRNGKLPELPFDNCVVPIHTLSTSSLSSSSTKTIIGYGPHGFHVRCGAALHLPNTMTAEGMECVQKLRRWHQRRSGKELHEQEEEEEQQEAEERGEYEEIEGQ